MLKSSTLHCETILEKGSGRVCEDTLLVSNNLFAVFDGASAVVPNHITDAVTGGQHASTIARRSFAGNTGDLKSLVLGANELLRSEMQLHDAWDKGMDNRWALVLATVRVNPDSIEWAAVGDCTIIAINDDSSFRLLGGFEDHDTGTMLQWKALAEQKVENIHLALRERISFVRSQANTTYGMINGSERVANFIRSGTEPPRGISKLLLFTDGLLIPRSDPKAEVPFSEMINAYLSGGLQAVLNLTRDLERTDPKCWHYPRFKCHDDVAAIAVML